MSLKIIVLLYLLSLLFLYLNQDQIIFAKQTLKTSISLQAGTSSIHFSHQGEQLHGWFIARKNKPLLIYYGGNAEEVSGNLERLQTQQSFSVLLLNYRGYGESSGQPSETTLIADAVFVFDQMIAQHNIDAATQVFLMGRSLGSGVAVQLAAQRQVAGVFLVTPYDNLAEVAARKYPLFPVRWLVKHRFDSLSYAPHIHTPAFFMLAEVDQLIPAVHALHLKSAWAGASQQHIFKGTEHHNISHQAHFWPKVESYILSHTSSL